MARQRLERQIEKQIKEKGDAFEIALETLNANNGAAPSENGAAPEAVPTYELISTIEKEEIDWLWNDRIPRGKITDFAGDPGVGKSTVASMIAATLSTGKALPFDREPEAPLRSLIISNEDTPGDVLRPRLERMGADISMIAIPARSLTVNQINAEIIDRIVSDLNPALVIIDPVISYTGGRNSNKADDVRSFLNGISDIAQRYKVAAILIRHFNKNIANSALYRSSGSIDWNAVARSAFVFAEDPTASQRRFMAHSKVSIAKKQATLEYFIDDDGTFRWGIETDQSADEVVRAGGHQANKADDFLKAFLAKGPLPFNEIQDAFEKKGLARSAIWKAKLNLNVKVKKEPETGGFIWGLPSSPPE